MRELQLLAVIGYFFSLGKGTDGIATLLRFPEHEVYNRLDRARRAYLETVPGLRMSADVCGIPQTFPEGRPI